MLQCISIQEDLNAFLLLFVRECLLNVPLDACHHGRQFVGPPSARDVAISPGILSRDNVACVRPNPACQRNKVVRFLGQRTSQNSLQDPYEHANRQMGLGHASSVETI